MFQYANDEAPKSAENVGEFFKFLLIENGWQEDKIKDVIVVTDEATNFSFG